MNGLNYQEEAQVYRELDKKGAKIKRLEAEIARLKTENAKLREAISRYCHNDCYRDSCDGNEDVGIPDCPLVKYRPLPDPPQKG